MKLWILPLYCFFMTLALANEPEAWIYPRIDQPHQTLRVPAQPEFSNSKPRVIIFMSSKCPCSKAHEPLLAQFAQRYSAKVDFVGVVAGGEPEAKEHFEKAHLPFPIVQDLGYSLSNALGARATPHVFVHQRDRLVYQGGIDNSHDPARATEGYLEPVLEALVAGKTSPFSEKRSLGCIIRR